MHQWAEVFMLIQGWGEIILVFFSGCFPHSIMLGVGEVTLSRSITQGYTQLVTFGNFSIDFDMPKSIPSKIKLTHILLECMSKSWRSVYPETRWRHNQIFSAYPWRFAGAEKRLTRSANYYFQTPTKIFRLIESLFDSFSYLCRLFEHFHLGRYFFYPGPLISSSLAQHVPNPLSSAEIPMNW